MKMKNTAVDNDSENEFDVDEPDEIQNNASDDDWTPEDAQTGGRRQSRRLRGTPRATFTEVPSDDDELSDEDEEDFDSEEENRKRRSKQKRGGGRKPKRAKVSSTTNENSESGDGDKSINNSDSEPSAALYQNPKFGKQFASGSFVVLKTDLEKDGHPPLWKIDGKALLQKYIPFEQDSKTYYKNTSVYSGWTVHNKNQYYSVTVTFKQQNNKEHIVEFNKEMVNKDEPVKSPAGSPEGDEDDAKEPEDEEEEEEDEEGSGGEEEDEEEEEEEDEEGEGEGEGEGDKKKEKENGKEEEEEEEKGEEADPAPASPNTTPSAE